MENREDNPWPHKTFVLGDLFRKRGKVNIMPIKVNLMNLDLNVKSVTVHPFAVKVRDGAKNFLAESVYNVRDGGVPSQNL